ncbi:unnamed protein product [Rotaria socialis]|uniref:Uncharacterized protein n=2 Tax=Rotaria socialis TaxID=392032 RepID=A0A821UYR0_9BILA|nr:unnamed protein product [Rotaria socialis]
MYCSKVSPFALIKSFNLFTILRNSAVVNKLDCSILDASNPYTTIEAAVNFAKGYIKTNVYKTRVNDIDDLNDRIEREIKAIKRETLDNGFNSIVKRLKLCIDVAGVTFEQIVYSDDEINDDDGDDETNENNQSQVKAIIDHPLMRTVYAIHYDPIKHRLYAVSGRLRQSYAMGFTFSVHPESFGQLITTCEPNDKFGDPHDLALSVNGRSLYVGEIRSNRIDSFNVLN